MYIRFVAWHVYLGGMQDAGASHDPAPERVVTVIPDEHWDEEVHAAVVPRADAGVDCRPLPRSDRRLQISAQPRNPDYLLSALRSRQSDGSQLLIDRNNK